MNDSVAAGHETPSVFVLTWNPAVWALTEEDLQSTIAATARGGTIAGSWATGSRKSGIEPDDHLVMMRQGTERGLIAHGLARSTIQQGEHFLDPSKTANYVEVEWTLWLDTDERIPVEELRLIAPQTNWNAILGSGIKLPTGDAKAVLTAFDLINVRGSSPLPGDEGVTGLPEGAVKVVSVNRFERNRSARRKCLEVHGFACKACGVDFGETYGELGEGFIHVHHVVPISSIGKAYVVDPVKDLVPVCPNCHAMLHHGVTEPRSIQELQALIKASR